MSVVGGVRNADRCCFETNTSRSDDRFRRAGIDLRLWDGVGMVEPGNIRRARRHRQAGRHFTSGLRQVRLRLARYVFWLRHQSLLGLFPAIKDVVARLHGDVLNARDMAQQRRGYYEELDVGGMDNWRWQDAEEPEGWSKGKKAFFRERSDFLLRDIVPSMSTVLGGDPLHVQFPGHARSRIR